MGGRVRTILSELRRFEGMTTEITKHSICFFFVPCACARMGGENQLWMCLEEVLVVVVGLVTSVVGL